MDKTSFNSEYKIIKQIFETIDPVGFGAAGEYDDAIFTIIRENERVTDAAVLTASICKVLSSKFGLEANDLDVACREAAQQILSKYPGGL